MHILCYDVKYRSHCYRRPPTWIVSMW